MTINERIFELMDKKSLKMVDLANKLNVSKSVVSTWKKRGTTPPMEYAERICELLEVPIEFLITGKNANSLSMEEQKIILAYRKAEIAIQIATKKLLDVNEGEDMERLSSSKTG